MIIRHTGWWREQDIGPIQPGEIRLVRAVGEIFAVAGNAHYTVHPDGSLDAPCGCPACDDGDSVQHQGCALSPNDLLRAEQAGMVVRKYDSSGGGWRWFLA
jgi:hypothetical protein